MKRVFPNNSEDEKNNTNQFFILCDLIRVFLCLICLCVCLFVFLSLLVYFIRLLVFISLSTFIYLFIYFPSSFLSSLY